MKLTKTSVVSCLVLVLSVGCLFILTGWRRPPSKPERVSIQGEITTVVKDWGDEPGTLGRGTWCCRSCSGGGAAGPLKCTSCKAASAAGCGVHSEPILVDCPGTTTDQGGTV